MASELRFRIEKLDASHDRTGFDCGEPVLDDFLRQFARQNARKGLSMTYVAVEPGSRVVLAYYSVSSGQVSCDALSDTQRAGLPRYPVPVVRLVRLATHRPVQRRGLGRLMVVDALRRTLKLADDLGVHAVEVEALTAKARDFYRSLGFEPLRDDDQHLYLPVRTIRRLFASSAVD